MEEEEESTKEALKKIKEVSEDVKKVEKSVTVEMEEALPEKSSTEEMDTLSRASTLAMDTSSR